MSLLLDKIGHFLGIQRNREDGLQINPPDSWLYSIATRYVTGYNLFVIKDFKHKGLEKLFLTGSKVGIQAAHAKKLRLILGRLHASTSPRDMNLPGLFLHKLKGDKQDTWSVRVSGNWRVTFRFDGVDATVVNYEDYH